MSGRRGETAPSSFESTEYLPMKRFLRAAAACLTFCLPMLPAVAASDFPRRSVIKS